MKTTRPIVLAVLLAAAGLAHGAKYCGELKNHFGPFDYRERALHENDFYLVEHAHFTPDVENGIKGATAPLPGDIGYVLGAIPNHAPALASLARYAVRKKGLEFPGLVHPVECYFERAIRMAPDDGAVYAEYGIYMHALGKSDKELEAFRRAVELSPENPTINYNLGLAYYAHKDYDKAAVYAHKAYALGFPLPGLKQKLAAMGKWQEQAPAQATTKAPAAAGAAASN